MAKRSRTKSYGRTIEWKMAEKVKETGQKKIVNIEQDRNKYWGKTDIKRKWSIFIWIVYYFFNSVSNCCFCLRVTIFRRYIEFCSIWIPKQKERQPKQTKPEKQKSLSNGLQIEDIDITFIYWVVIILLLHWLCNMYQID